ncbi:hypothetical protein [Metapseudomonas boanensis]|uniref:Uncharacterized protein n=1 Tax=Metapseudomonas boanensis TaxID=2822138 RepID=A0ABS5XMD7_9GAMM|nr:hypothetical protein [Pseudomonas boanensis]MBT8768852.1 hypothetical protein [Pseudomonas boanensis]
MLRPWLHKFLHAIQALRTLPDQPFVLAEISNDLEPLRALNIRSPAQQGDIALSARLNQGVAQQPAVDGLRYETIHQVKGGTHDATVVVSSAWRSPFPLAGQAR